MKKIYILVSTVCIAAISFVAGNAVTAQSLHINGPLGSGQFGQSVKVLSNGNYVVVDPYYDEGAVSDVGAVYLYNGNTHALISTLKGSKLNDNIGIGGVIGLSNSNYVVISKNWDNGAAINVGAVTFGNGVSGINGIVSTGNSLIGSTTDDAVGSVGVKALNNGNYVVSSNQWDNGPEINAGAVTFANGTTGVTGVVSSVNSLVGGTSNDNVGLVTALTNGNYLVHTQNWNNGATVDAGAVTWGNGNIGVAGVVSSSNSLVGGGNYDQVGNYGITVLSNGNYVVRSDNWDNGAVPNELGAVTWGNGSTGIVGVVSSINSLVGSRTDDRVGSYGITGLSNGNYVVSSPVWDYSAGQTNAGAVTFGSGTTGVSGVVSSINSLVGNIGNSNVGSGGITALSNGNYVVNSHTWWNGAINQVGAVTFGNGTTGISGLVSSINSLVGGTFNDQVGRNDIGSSGVTALSNGNYVVSSVYWRNGTVLHTGAVTFGNGTTGVNGVVSSSNSLVGSTATDNVGIAVTALSNGNYVVSSKNWDNGVVANTGAVTFGNGTIGINGIVSSSNSLVGNTANDNVGLGDVTALSNGNYVVSSPTWDNGAATDAGAVTFGSGTAGVSGAVSSINSLVGSAANDYVSINPVTALSNGNYVVRSDNWKNGTVAFAGAVTFGSGTTGVVGPVSSINSLVGSAANDEVGSYGITTLSNGNYVVRSSAWNNGAAVNAGAITLGSGTAGVTGTVSSINSLVGSAAYDEIGSVGVTALSNGNYVVSSPTWDNGASTNAGAVTTGNGSSGVSGTITTCNSVLGTAAFGGVNMVSAFNSTYDYLIVGRRSDNIVTVYNPSSMALANSLDATTVNINGTNSVPLIANTGCRILASLTPNAGSPVNGIVNAKVWIEPTVPTYEGKPFVARHFEITPATNAATATGRVTLYCAQQEFDDFNADPASIYDLPAYPNDILGKYNLKIGKYPGSSSDGSGLPGTYTGPNQVINPDDDDIVWNSVLNRWEISFNVTGFSGFIIQSNSFLLPLTLLSFSGLLQNNNGILNWKTTNELNTHSFDLERSSDRRNYTTVGNVSAFNTPGDHQYHFTDNNINLLAVPVVYYRLKQKDIGGRFTYSSIVALSMDDNKSIVMFYPNPVINEANLTITVNKPQQVQGRIVDNAGRLVKQMQWNITTGSTALPVDVKGLAKGVYYLELKGETINERKQFVKQ